MTQTTLDIFEQFAPYRLEALRTFTESNLYQQNTRKSWSLHATTCTVEHSACSLSGYSRANT